MAPHAIDSMPSGQCVRLMSEKFIHKSDINQITPRMDQGGFGHPFILLKRSHDGFMALIALISSFGYSSRGTAQAPWGRPDLRKIHSDKKVFRAAANCNSERPDPSRPFIQLQHGIHFNFPTARPGQENKQLTRESLSDLLAHMRQAAPQRWRDVNNAMVTTATTTASGPSLTGLPTPPSTPPARLAASPSPPPPPPPPRQIDQSWRRSQTPASFAGDTDKRKRRTSSSDGEKDCKVQKVEEWRLSAGPVGQCCGGVVKEEGDGRQWCTVVQKRKRGKK
ncbi:hypothetical protein QC763_600325 [Podospora pseudopauciseta]|uniref:YTH domain-containing protein n=1 Tax=Podospora pseudopauciseta TaxID=2093780 RepID=A0ABR0H528_9PEZI|nr:hypothetical protein QC763_600325 [Podospora pseudopauciseta]